MKNTIERYIPTHSKSYLDKRGKTPWIVSLIGNNSIRFGLAVSNSKRFNCNVFKPEPFKLNYSTNVQNYCRSAIISLFVFGSTIIMLTNYVK